MSVRSAKRASRLHPLNVEDENVTVKSLSVPAGLEALMEGLTKEVLKHQPNDIYTFASRHFQKLITIRDAAGDEYMPKKSAKGNKYIIKKIHSEETNNKSKNIFTGINKLSLGVADMTNSLDKLDKKENKKQILIKQKSKSSKDKIKSIEETKENETIEKITEEKTKDEIKENKSTEDSVEEAKSENKLVPITGTSFEVAKTLFENFAEPENPNEENVDENNNAAVRIQSLWRGYKARRILQLHKQKMKELETQNDDKTEEKTDEEVLVSSGNEIGKMINENDENEDYVNDEELVHAATQIQAAWRGHNTRKTNKTKEETVPLDEKSIKTNPIGNVSTQSMSKPQLVKSKNVTSSDELSTTEETKSEVSSKEIDKTSPEYIHIPLKSPNLPEKDTETVVETAENYPVSEALSKIAVENDNLIIIDTDELETQANIKKLTTIGSKRIEDESDFSNASNDVNYVYNENDTDSFNQTDDTVSFTSTEDAKKYSKGSNKAFVVLDPTNEHENETESEEKREETIKNDVENEILSEGSFHSSNIEEKQLNDDEKVNGDIKTNEEEVKQMITKQTVDKSNNLQTDDEKTLQDDEIMKKGDENSSGSSENDDNNESTAIISEKILDTTSNRRNSTLELPPSINMEKRMTMFEGMEKSPRSKQLKRKKSPKPDIFEEENHLGAITEEVVPISVLRATVKIQSIWRGFKTRREKEKQEELQKLQKPAECDELPEDRDEIDEKLQQSEENTSKYTPSEENAIEIIPKISMVPKNFNDASPGIKSNYSAYSKQPNSDEDDVSEDIDNLNKRLSNYSASFYSADSLESLNKPTIKEEDDKNEDDPLNRRLSTYKRTISFPTDTPEKKTDKIEQIEEENTDDELNKRLESYKQTNLSTEVIETKKTVGEEPEETEDDLSRRLSAFKKSYSYSSPPTELKDSIKEEVTSTNQVDDDEDVIKVEIDRKLSKIIKGEEDYSSSKYDLEDKSPLVNTASQESVVEELSTIAYKISAGIAIDNENIVQAIDSRKNSKADVEYIHIPLKGPLPQEDIMKKTTAYDTGSVEYIYIPLKSPGHKEEDSKSVNISERSDSSIVGEAKTYEIVINKDSFISSDSNDAIYIPLKSNESERNSISSASTEIVTDTPQHVVAIIENPLESKDCNSPNDTTAEDSINKIEDETESLDKNSKNLERPVKLDPGIKKSVDSQDLLDSSESLKIEDAAGLEVKEVAGVTFCSKHTIKAPIEEESIDEDDEIIKNHETGEDQIDLKASSILLSDIESLSNSPEPKNEKETRDMLSETMKSSKDLSNLIESDKNDSKLEESSSKSEDTISSLSDDKNLLNRYTLKSINRQQSVDPSNHKKLFDEIDTIIKTYGPTKESSLTDSEEITSSLEKNKPLGSTLNPVEYLPAEKEKEGSILLENTPVSTNLSTEVVLDEKEIKEKDEKLKHSSEMHDAVIPTPTNLAKLEENAEEQAAIKIQSRFRGHKTRKQLKKQGEETKTAPKLVHSGEMHDSLEFMSLPTKQNEEQAAIKIQSAFRGHSTRKQLKTTSTKLEHSGEMHDSIDSITLPQNDEKVNPKDNNSKLEHSGEMYDSIVPTIEHKEPQLQEELAAVKIQSVFRGHNARKQLRNDPLKLDLNAEIPEPIKLEENTQIDENKEDTAGEQIKLEHSGEMHDSIETTKLEEGTTLSDEDKKEVNDGEKPKLEHSGEMHDSIDQIVMENKGQTDLDKKEVELAAIKIQSVYRGHNIRKQLKNNVPIANVTENIAQNIDRNLEKPDSNTEEHKYSETKLEDDKKAEEMAAIKIQSVYRGHNIRKNLKNEIINNITEKTPSSNLEHSGEMHDSVDSIILDQKENITDEKNQKLANKMEETSPPLLEHSGEMHDSIILPDIEHSIKVPTEKEEEAAAIKIQSVFRGHNTRKLLKKDENSSTNIENTVETIPQAKEDKTEEKITDKNEEKEDNPIISEEELAATKIQSIYRGHITRKKLQNVSTTNKNNPSLKLEHSSEMHDCVLPEQQKEPPNTTGDDVTSVNQNDLTNNIETNDLPNTEDAKTTENQAHNTEDAIIEQDNIEIKDLSSSGDGKTNENQKESKSVDTAPSVENIPSVENEKTTDNELHNNNIAIEQNTIELKDLPRPADEKTTDNLKENKLVETIPQNSIETNDMSSVEVEKTTDNQHVESLHAETVEQNNIETKEVTKEEKETSDNELSNKMDENTAATTIQKSFRNYKTRQLKDEDTFSATSEEINELLQDVNILELEEKLDKQSEESSDWEDPKINDAAVKIQSTYRGFKTRREMRKCNYEYENEGLETIPESDSPTDKTRLEDDLYSIAQEIMQRNKKDKLVETQATEDPKQNTHLETPTDDFDIDSLEETTQNIRPITVNKTPTPTIANRTEKHNSLDPAQTISSSGYDTTDDATSSDDQGAGTHRKVGRSGSETSGMLEEPPVAVGNRRKRSARDNRRLEHSGEVHDTIDIFLSSEEVSQGQVYVIIVSSSPGTDFITVAVTGDYENCN